MTIPELRALLSRATPGPWHTIMVLIRCEESCGSVGDGKTVAETRTGPAMLDDAALIAAAVNALPALLDAVEAAQRLLDDVKQRHPGEELRCPYTQALDAAVARLGGE